MTEQLKIEHKMKRVEKAGAIDRSYNMLFNNLADDANSESQITAYHSNSRLQKNTSVLLSSNVNNHFSKQVNQLIYQPDPQRNVMDQDRLV